MIIATRENEYFNPGSIYTVIVNDSILRVNMIRTVLQYVLYLMWFYFPQVEPRARMITFRSSIPSRNNNIIKTKR